jgi:RimJ/RimL family protein N-acetyltransferase
MYQPPPVFPEQIVTERLVLRPYRPGDGRWYAEMSARNRPHLARYEADNPVMTIRSAEDAEAVLRTFAADRAEGRAFFLGCFLKDDGAFAGQLYLGCLSWEPPEFALGYFADAEHTGRGYLTEAARAVLRLCFEQLGARRVRLECDDTNGPSARLAERLGFALKEHLHETHRWPDGSLSGTLRYTLELLP